DGQAEQAARFYVSLLPDSRIERVMRSPADSPSGPAGCDPRRRPPPVQAGGVSRRAGFVSRRGGPYSSRTEIGALPASSLYALRAKGLPGVQEESPGVGSLVAACEVALSAGGPSWFAPFPGRMGPPIPSHSPVVGDRSPTDTDGGEDL